MEIAVWTANGTQLIAFQLHFPALVKTELLKKFKGWFILSDLLSMVT